MDHLSAALAGSQHCTRPDCMGNEGRDGGRDGKESEERKRKGNGRKGKEKQNVEPEKERRG